MIALIGLVITVHLKTFMMPPQPFPTMEACQTALELVEQPIPRPGAPKVQMWGATCIEFHDMDDNITL